MVRASRKIAWLLSRIWVLMVPGFCSLHASAQERRADSDRKIVAVVSSSKHTEFAPTISADGRTLIFESDRDSDKRWKLYESHLDKQGRWSEPVPIKAVNDKLHFLAGPSLSYDGNMLLFTGFIENVTTSEDIYYSRRIDEGNWSEPVNIGPPINTEAYEGFPSISADGNSIYFIRQNDENLFDRKSKEACFKIFVSNKKPDGSWGEPTALPEPINKGCERDPKIMADNHTLIFSSIQHDGKGKYDLYQTKKIDEYTWEAPVPLDFINGEENDQSPCIAASGDIIFFYSNDDIYSVPIPRQYRQMINVTVQGVVHDQKTKRPLKASILITNVTTGQSFTAESNENNGRYSVVLSAAQEYTVTFVNNDFVPEQVTFDLRAQNQYVEITRDIALRDSYLSSIEVLDRETLHPLIAWVGVRDEHGNALFSDSLKMEQYPFSIQFHAGKNYTISIVSRDYKPLEDTLTFDAVKTQTGMTQRFLLDRIKIPFTPDVVNIVSKEKVKSKVYFSNERTDELMVASPGETVYLRKGDRYLVTTSSDKGFMFASTTITAEGNGETQEAQRLSLSVVPIEKGVQLTLSHIVFPVNSADIDPSSFTTLERVIELLQINPQVSIEVSAHTDDIGDDTYNKRLSERRALAIVRHLSKNGIYIARMRPTGYGEQTPLVPNDSEEHRALNRRVELKVLTVR